MTQVLPGLYYRHLELCEVLARQRARSVAEVAVHNAHVVEQLDLQPRASVHDQVLAIFDPTTRRLAR